MTDVVHLKDSEFKYIHAGIYDFHVQYEGVNGATILSLFINLLWLA